MRLSLRRLVSIVVAAVLIGTGLSFDSQGLTFRNAPVHAADPDGTSMQNAIPLPVPGSASGPARTSGATWFQLTGQQPYRTVEVNAPGATSLSWRYPNSISGNVCTYATCYIVPDSSSTYLLEATGPAGSTITITAADGSSREQAYRNTTRDNQIYYNSSAWYKTSLPQAGKRYGVYLRGAVSGAVYHGADAEPLVSGTGPWLYFTATGDGPYYVQLNSGSSAAVVGFTLQAEGEGIPTAVPYVVNSTTTTPITSTGSLWLKLTGHKLNRTVQFPQSNIGFYYESGTAVSSFYAKCATNRCTLLPSQSEPYYIKASGAPGAGFTLSSVDGSTQELAYGPFAPLPIKDHTIPAGEASWFALSFSANHFYGIQVPSAAALAVYQGDTLVASGTGSWLNVVTTTAGIYHLKVTAGSSPLPVSMDFYSEGTRRETAFPFPLWGPQTATISSTDTFFRIDSVPSYRSLVVKTAPASGVTISSIKVQNANGTQLASCLNTVTCRVNPDSAAPYYVLIQGSGTGTYELSAVDGSTQNLAYGPFATVPTQGYEVLSGLDSWFAFQMKENHFYGISVPGAAKLELYQGSTLVGSATGPWLNVRTTAAGIYHLKVAAGSSFIANIGFYSEGALKETAVPFALYGPKTDTISTTDYWYQIDGMTARRSLVMTATPASGVTVSSIRILNKSGTQLASCTTTTCKADLDGNSPYYVTVKGSGSGTYTLSAVDGSAQSLAYGPFAPTIGSGSYLIPPNSDGWFKATLTANTFYGIEAPQAAAIAVYDGSTLVASGTGSWLTFTTTATAGTYHFKVTAPAAFQTQGVKLYLQGSRPETAFVYTPHGPQEFQMLSYGSIWARIENVREYQTMVLTVTRPTGQTVSKVEVQNAAGASMASCTTTTCSFNPNGTGPYYVKVSGTNTGTLTLTSKDGSTRDLAYGPFAATIGSGNIKVAPYSDGWFMTPTLNASTSYTLTAPGAAALTIYLGDTVVASGTGASLQFTTPATTGTYYIKVSVTNGAFSTGIRFY